MDSANKFVGNPKASPYCAALGSLAVNKAGLSKPKSGLARNMRTKDTYNAYEVVRGIRKVHQGDGLIWQKGQTLFGHFGFADTDWENGSGYTVEGNTSPDNRGSQSNGGGVYRRKRSINPTSYFRIVAVTPINYSENVNKDHK